jgi:hypothetical protein
MLVIKSGMFWTFLSFALLFLISLIFLGVYLSFQGKKKILKQKILDRFYLIKNKNLPNKYYLLELDKLLEFAFKQTFGSKESLGKILKSRKTHFSKERLNNIWFAHKLRNKLAHDVDFQASDTDLIKAIKAFENELINL